MNASLAAQLRKMPKRLATRIRDDAIARNTVLLVTNGLITGAGTLIFWFITARIYAPEVVGIASAGTSIVILLAGVGHLGLGTGIIRFSAALGDRRRRRLRLSGIFLATGTAAVLAGVAFWQLTPYLIPELTLTFSTAGGTALVLVSCLGWTVSVQYDCYLMSRRFIGLLVIKSVVVATMRILLIVALSRPSVATLIALTGVCGIIGILAVLPIVARRPLTRAETAGGAVPLGTLIAFSLWNYIVGLASTAPPLAMPALVVSLIGGAEAAAFYMAWSMFSVLLLIPLALSTIVLTERSAAPGPGDKAVALTDRQSDLAMATVTALFLPVAMLVLMLLGRAYITFGLGVLLVLALGIWPNHRASILVTELRITGSQGLLALAYTSSQLAVIAGSIPLLRVLGVVGAALAWTAGQYLLFGWLHLNHHRHRDENSALASIGG